MELSSVSCERFAPASPTGVSAAMKPIRNDEGVHLLMGWESSERPGAIGFLVWCFFNLTFLVSQTRPTRHTSAFRSHGTSSEGA